MVDTSCLSLMWKRKKICARGFTFYPCWSVGMLWIYVRKDLFCVNHLVFCNFWGWINHAYVKPGSLTMIDHNLLTSCKIWPLTTVQKREIKLENMSKGSWQCFWKTYLMDGPLAKYFEYPQGIINTIFYLYICSFSHSRHCQPAETVSSCPAYDSQ